MRDFCAYPKVVYVSKRDYEIVKKHVKSIVRYATVLPNLDKAGKPILFYRGVEVKTFSRIIVGR